MLEREISIKQFLFSNFYTANSTKAVFPKPFIVNYERVGDDRLMLI